MQVLENTRHSIVDLIYYLGGGGREEFLEKELDNVMP